MPNCNRLIMSEQSRDYIVESNLTILTSLENREDTCVKCLSDTWCIVYNATEIDAYNSGGNIGYFTVPKLYGLMDTLSFDAAGITETINQPILDARGQGVIIGFVDTGIDYMSASFQRPDGKTKIAAIWDQTLQPQNVQENGWLTGSEEYEQFLSYGLVYTSDDINQALAAARAGEDPYALVPTRDRDGHGTFMAGVAAAADTGEYSGAAPEAEILMVKLKPAKQYLRDYFLIKEDAPAFAETDILMGISFLQNYALQQKKPLVICLGLGTGSGPRTGAAPLADYLENIAKQVNSVVVTCVGNEGNERLHVAGNVFSSEEPAQIEIAVGEYEKGFALEIWAESLGLLSVSLVSPSGEVIPRIPARLNSVNVFQFLLERTQVTVDYRVVETVSGYEVILLRFQRPAQGIWRVRIYSLTNIVGAYNAWLPLRQFLSSDTYFLNATPETTITEPSAAMRPISVGAYNHVTGAIYLNSGRGYSANNAVKPDFVAPGVDVYGPEPGGGFTRRTGTSVAAAHAAGAAALLLSWATFYENYAFIGTSEIKSILIRGAQRDGNREYPNNAYGYGKLNVIESFIAMRVT